MKPTIDPSKNYSILPLRNTVLFPEQSIPLFVGRRKSIQAIQSAWIANDLIVCVAQKGDLLSEEPTQTTLHQIGTLARIESAQKDEKGHYQVTVTGVARVHLQQVQDQDGMLVAQIASYPEVEDFTSEDEKALIENLKKMSLEILRLLPYNTEKVQANVENVREARVLSHMISQYIDLNLDERQDLLAENSLRARLLKLVELLAERRERVKVQQEIGAKVSQKMGKQQRDVILREQIRALQEELGDDEKNDMESLRKKILDAKMSEEAEKVAFEQLKRLEATPPQSPETNIIRNYLDTLVAMPWSKSSESNIDLEKAREILDGDHYGLEKVKKRILQHLAVMKLKKSKGGSFVLLVGPPGVGKTSLGQSIAKALGRKYVRASLGGVRDDAEVRGHRRTYLGALPGRIIDGIKRAGENNPVFVLDEIDKLSRGYTGDPAAALLEVLDPEQNNKFLDHYLDVPFDLSQVFFVATANSLEGIPGPLLDRMEIIELSGYTTGEKLHIAKNYLIPKQWEAHGIAQDELKLNDEVLLEVISHYTREAGVRELQRKLAAIARGLSEKIIGKTEGQVFEVQSSDLEELLGPERYSHDVTETKVPPGVATGLAWTPVGGDILLIEGTVLPGNGQLVITGQLGDVMKESARIAMSLARLYASRYPESVNFEKTDLHIHVPAGAIPKDGPSAGVTMLTAMTSLLLKQSVSPQIAMTGEITLRGAVLPVGGIKEKVIAAHRAGVKTLILPKKNEKHMKEVPEEVKKDLRVHFVERVEELLEVVFQRTFDYGLWTPVGGAGFPPAAN